MKIEELLSCCYFDDTVCTVIQVYNSSNENTNVKGALKHTDNKPTVHIEDCKDMC